MKNEKIMDEDYNLDYDEDYNLEEKKFLGFIPVYKIKKINFNVFTRLKEKFGSAKLYEYMESKIDFDGIKTDEDFEEAVEKAAEEESLEEFTEIEDTKPVEPTLFSKIKEKIKAFFAPIDIDEETYEEDVEEIEFTPIKKVKEASSSLFSKIKDKFKTVFAPIKIEDDEELEEVETRKVEVEEFTDEEYNLKSKSKFELLKEKYKSSKLYKYLTEIDTDALDDEDCYFEEQEETEASNNRVKKESNKKKFEFIPIFRIKKAPREVERQVQEMFFDPDYDLREPNKFLKFISIKKVKPVAKKTYEQVAERYLLPNLFKNEKIDKDTVFIDESRVDAKHSYLNTATALKLGFINEVEEPKKEKKSLKDFTPIKKIKEYRENAKEKLNNNTKRKVLTQN